MFATNKKRRAAVVAIAFMIVGTGTSAASAHADGSKGGGTRVPLTATQEACLTAQGHVHPNKSVPHVKDAAHKAANDAAYAACGITRGTKSSTTTAAS